MEYRLPKEIKGHLPPNTMDTDFKAELYGALLSEAGFDTTQIMMVRDGNNLSNVSKDIRSVKHRNLPGMADSCIEVKTNRRGIYDSLPEGLFHDSLFPGKVKDLELILEEMQQHRNEEFFIRRFSACWRAKWTGQGYRHNCLNCGTIKRTNILIMRNSLPLAGRSSIFCPDGGRCCSLSSYPISIRYGADWKR
ncbi:hypothetical protein OXV67_01685 [Bacteroides fragilis]|uniref:hypothetical protein n=1 Tax=Bacteroides hominis TaxID=2763023 RepID=UPI00227C4A1D|nr:hypothetical protein [Bacteroides fragilis]MCY6337572.1 hypothetical protein [Bacteroides fragilis]